MNAIVLMMALAQQPVGNYLPRTEFQTYSAKTFYVGLDGGSDSNNCTSVATPCLTPHAVVAKLPRFLRHSVTVNVAAGDGGAWNFATPLTFDGFEMADGVSIAFQGDTNWQTVTPPTGSASGTLTSVTALSFPNRYILTDSAQSWPAYGYTADSVRMRGDFVCFTSGAAAGTKYPIVGHSSTTLELSTTPSPAPSAGTTYSICRPSTVWSLASASVGQVVRIQGPGSGQISFTDMAFSGPGPATASTGPLIRVVGALNTAAPQLRTSLSLTRVYSRNLNSSALPTSLQCNTIGECRITASSFPEGTQLEGQSSSGTATFGPQNTSRGAIARVVVSSSYLRDQRNVLSAYAAAATFSGVVLDAENITNNNVAFFSDSKVNFANTWLRCYSTVGGLTSSMTGIEGDGVQLSATSLSIDGCTAGIDFATTQNTATRRFPSAVRTTSASASLHTLNNNTATAAGVRLGVGSVVSFQGTHTNTGVADGGRAWVCPDGATAYTDSQVVALPGSTLECQGATVVR